MYVIFGVICAMWGCMFCASFYCVAQSGSDNATGCLFACVIGMTIVMGLIAFVVGIALSSSQLAENARINLLTDQFYDICNSGCVDSDVEETLSGLKDIPAQIEKLDSRASLIKNFFLFTLISIFTCFGCCGYNHYTEGEFF